jgi:hypothetical protein
MSSILDFIDKTKGLTRNPLSIIALFVSLIYGFACLVLSTSLNNLSGQEERLPLIWFTIVFPIIILAAFVYLVIKHHHKLYGPSDYKDESNFIKIGSYDKGKTFAKDFVPPRANDDAINALLGYASVKGLYALYAIHLACEARMQFKLSDLESNVGLLTEDYTHGFLVAASSLGAFTFATVEQPYFIPSVNEKLAEKIKDVCYMYAEIDKKEDNSNYLYEQLSLIESSFKPKIKTT